MFYRFVGDVRRALDLEGLYSGACFLIGGAPSLKGVIEKLNKANVVKAVMNNTATLVKPTLWFAADNPMYYSPSLLLDSTFMKFAIYSRRNCDVRGTPWRGLSNTLFLWIREGVRHENFFERAPFLSWDRNVFTLAIQTLYILGFDTVYCIGTDMRANFTEPYAYASSLSLDMVKYNQRTYDQALGKLKAILPYARDFKVISCGADSKLNAIIPYVEFEKALQMVEAQIPKIDTKNVIHPVMEKKGS